MHGHNAGGPFSSARATAARARAMKHARKPLTAKQRQVLLRRHGADAVVEFKHGTPHNYFLSSFWRHPVMLHGVQYPTAEHAFQAQKTTDRGERLAIAAAPDASISKTMGDGRSKMCGEARTGAAPTGSPARAWTPWRRCSQQRRAAAQHARASKGAQRLCARAAGNLPTCLLNA
jgi:hypothetical protein